MPTPFDDLRCVDCDHLWSEHSHIPDDPYLNFVMDNETAEDLRRYLIDLAAKVESLRAELALAVAVCVDCGKVTRCDEDRCCLTCGRDLILLSDQHSADVLDASLEQLGNDFVKEWSDGL